jgi:hypothetical protein
MADAAYHGITGEVVKTIEPHSEGDPVALTLQFLTLAGNVIGRLPHYQVESDRHHVNLNVVLVGTSAKGRKGTSFGRVRAVVQVADDTWAGDRVKGGLSSGEGLINEVRDPVQKWNTEQGKYETVDPGAPDKRLMIVEPEFAGVLSVAERPGNTISSLIRRAWDGDKLQTLTKNSPLCATGAHISIIGHITEDELRARRWRELGYLRGTGKFSWQWTRDRELTAFLAVEANGNLLTLKYLSQIDGSWRETLQRVVVDWTPCRFGGERPWFECGCGRRVVALYTGSRGFACRNCYGLAYTSQRVTDRERAVLKAQRIRSTLDGSTSVVGPFPERPKGLHRKRYAQLWQAYERADAKILVGFNQSIERLAHKIGK